MFLDIKYKMMGCMKFNMRNPNCKSLWDITRLNMLALVYFYQEQMCILHVSVQESVPMKETPAKLILQLNPVKTGSTSSPISVVHLF